MGFTTMTPLDLSEVVKYIHSNIDARFHSKKIEKIKKLTLDDIIRRKNPYLFKAKGINSASDFIKSVLDATVSSGEETTFGNFLENLAIFVCQKVYDGRKSSATGLDLEFEDGDKKYLVSIKSGPNWGNSGQIKTLIRNFNTAKKTLATSGGALQMNVICIEACCYGKDNSPHKGTHHKLCGQKFWELISGGNSSLYKDIIEPLGYSAREKNEEIDRICTQKLNLFTADFIGRFCEDGVINWDKLILFNSGQ